MTGNSVNCLQGSGDRTFERWAGIMVMQNGDVFSVGKNLNGCLGVAGIPDAKEPVKICVLSGKGVHGSFPIEATVSTDLHLTGQ